MTVQGGERAVDAPGTFAALRSAPYRRYMVGAALSQLSLYAYETVIWWRVYEASASAVAVGLLLTALTLPVLLFIMPAGTLTDRFGPRPVMLAATAAGCVMLVVATVLAAAGQLSIEAAIVLTFVEGTWGGLAAVPTQVYAARLVPPAQAPGAIGLSSAHLAIGSILGGISGGIALQLGGPAVALGFALVVFLVGGFFLWSLPDLPPEDATAPRSGLGLGLRGAFAWARESRTAVALLGLAAIAALFIPARSVLYPVLSKDALGTGPAGLGLITSATGVGMLVGAFTVELFGRRLGRGRAIVAGFGGVGLAFVGLGLAPGLPVAALFAATTAILFILWRTTSTMLLQLLAPPRIRGRIVSFFGFVFWGIAPIGSLAAGVLADQLGARTVFVLFGGLLVAGIAAAVFRAPFILGLNLEHAAPEAGA